VGKRLNESTQRRVIMMVLAMLFSVPILSISTYYQETDSFDFSMRYLDNFEANSDSFSRVFDQFLRQETQINTPIILISAG
jgi:hypothetical protein